MKKQGSNTNIPSNVRAASHANSWYTGDQKELDIELNSYLSKAQKDQAPINKLKALIAPHAGFYYSGPTAAWAYQYTQPSENLRVFLLGPCHHIYLKGCAVTGLDTFQTPLGNIEIDKKTVEELKKTGRFDTLSKEDEEEEHSLEMHLPYVIKTLGKQPFKLVPLMIGNLSYQKEQEYGQILSSYFDDENTIFLVSSDFCHWGSRFSFQYYQKTDGEIWQSIQKLDQTAIDIIEKHDAEAFNKYLETTENTICGRHPIGVLLQVIRNSLKYKNQIKTKAVHYEQSEQVKSAKSSSVSYASLISFI